VTDTWTWATVTQATPLRIKVDGDTSALDATTDNLVGLLAVDDRVRVHLHSDGIIVTGIQGGNDKAYVVASHPESDQPDAYPAGITVSDTSAGGWPSDLATVVTNAVSLSRTSQVVYEKTGGERQWWRTGLGTTWTAWKEVADMTWAGANRPAFMAGRSSDVTKSGTSSISTFVFDTTQLNNGGHYNTANGRFTAPVAGMYSFAVSTAQTTTEMGPELHAYKNGVRYVTNLAIGYSAAYMTFGGTVVVDLAVGDYFEIKWENRNNRTVTLGGSRSSFSGHYLG